MLNKLLALARGWEVTVRWGDLYKVHRASNWTDALEWMASWPMDADVIITRHGDFVASNRGLGSIIL